MIEMNFSYYKQWFIWCDVTKGDIWRPCFNIKTVFPGMEIPMIDSIEIRQLWYYLYLHHGDAFTVKTFLYWNSAQGGPFQYNMLSYTPMIKISPLSVIMGISVHGEMVDLHHWNVSKSSYLSVSLKNFAIVQLTVCEIMFTEVIDHRSRV